MDALISQISQSVIQARSLEELTRPLLKLLEAASGLESTYLTRIDLEESVQHILYSYNTDKMQIPEGLSVPWNDTLCKRALDENRPFSGDVGSCWGDSDAAAALGIQTYASTPVRMSNGTLYGTLCAASSSRHPLKPEAQQLLALFAQLIAYQVEREQLVQNLVEANAQLHAFATTDPLTGLANRRALMDALRRQLAQGQRQHNCVLLAFIDLDGFKAINDRYGHEVGDQLLHETALRLQRALRTEDLAARLGGDEFVVLGPGPVPGQTLEASRLALRRRIAEATQGHFVFGDLSIDYEGASVGAIAIEPGTLGADEALRLADQAMYETKNARRALQH
jgi:diguanylate cyclase